MRETQCLDGPCVVMLAMLGATVLVAGCLGGSDEPPGSDGLDAADSVLLRMGPAVTAMTGCPVGCWEPSVAVDAAGRIFATSAFDAAIAVSADGGRTFTTLPSPPPPEGAPDPIIRSDALVHTDPQGRLWYSALVGTVFGFVWPGLQVARSDDAGQTWAVNEYISITDGPDEPVIGVDRQWMGFATDGTAYLTYSQISGLASTGIWIARSNDGGATWTGWTRAAPYEERLLVGQHGPPVVAPDGSVLFPVFARTQGPGSRVTLAIVVSRDGGATFEQRTVAAGPEANGAWFPVATVGPAGTVHVAWRANDGRVHSASAASPEASWSEPVTWTRGNEKANQSAWLVAGPDERLDVAYYVEIEEGTKARVVLARGTASGPLDWVTLDEGISGNRGSAGNSDMMYAVSSPDERTVAVWSDSKTESLFVAVEEP